MDNLPPFLVYSIHAVAYFKYVLIFIGAIIEGPILMVASGFMLHLGLFTFWPLFIVLCLGDLVGDVIYYYIGYFYAEKFIRKFGRFLGLTIETFEGVKKFFYKHHTKILFFSKFVMGFGLAIYILMVAGATKVKFAKYMILNAIGELFFVGMLMYLGFSYGKAYNSIGNASVKLGFIAVSALILVIVIYNLQKYLRKKALTS